ncbi:MAG: gliding motility protein GldL [Bacteroidia bacterium]|nr:gliding motility protein GldL [Bacteroidia bacterium]
MAKKPTGLFHSRGWKKGVAMLYGIGASVVIIGALFKILHLPGANEMLIVGLGTEAVIFFVSAFEPLPTDETHWSWNKVFPQLAEDVDDDEVDIEMVDGGLTVGGVGAGPQFGALGSGLSQTQQLLQENQLTPELFESLADSINGLKVNVTQLAEISDVTVATNEFSTKLKAASTKIDQLNQGYGVTVEAMGSFSKSIDDVKSYQTQIQSVTQNLQSLNAVYQLELEDAQKHLNSINQFYGGIANVMQNLVDTSKETDTLKKEVTSLTNNMKSLNAIYGGMLSAMASGGKV